MLFPAAAILLSIFALAALVDGVWFHGFAQRLFARTESRYEHLLHTIRAALFPAIVLLLLRPDAVWAAAIVVAIDFGVEVLDVICERESRASLGGLPTAEYLTHVVAIGSRAAAVALAFAAKAVGEPVPAAVHLFALGMAGVGAGIAALHAVFILPAVQGIFRSTSRP